MTDHEIKKAVIELVAKKAKEREKIIADLVNSDNGIPAELRSVISVMLRTAWMSGRDAQREFHEGLEAIIKKHKTDNDQKKISQNSDPIGDLVAGSNRGS